MAVPPKEIIIRPAKPDDAEGILRSHRAAVYGKAAGHYTPKQLADWAATITPQSIEKKTNQLAQPDISTYIAEHEGTLIGFAEIVPSKNTLGAVYVAPGDWRGVGGLLLEEVESEARRLGLPHLIFDSSLNAESFYHRHGYKSLERTMHKSQSGAESPCVKMIKHFLSA